MVRSLPSSAEGAVELNKCEELVELGQDERIFSRKKLLLLLQNLEVTGTAREVAVGGNLNCNLVGLDGAGLLNHRFSVLLPRDKRI